MSHVFFLGGRDLEMLRIKEILCFQLLEFLDKQLERGAKASSYEKEINDEAQQGKIPVLVELEVDISLPLGSVVIDDHGDRSNEPASLLQVLDMIGLIPGQWDRFVAANDSGYIPAMMALGVSEVEIRRIRSLDRRAQGVTEKMERQAEEAIAHAEMVRGVVIVNLPHTKCSTVTDRLYGMWPDGKENLLVICGTPTSEVNYFGRGDFCKTIKEAFRGWGGGKGYGDPNGTGFAGCLMSGANTNKIRQLVINT